MITVIGTILAILFVTYVLSVVYDLGKNSKKKK